MRAASFIVSVLLAGSAYAQAPASVYTPTQRDFGVPTFINATVVRVDARRHTVTFRSESREVTLTTEGQAVARLGKLRPGDQVILGYRVDDRSGQPVQIVTAILAGEEMARRGFVTASSPVASASGTSFSTVTGRVIGVDRNAGTFTLVDAEGRTETLSAGTSALPSLGTIIPGDQVDVAFIPGATALGGGVIGMGGVIGTANGIQVATSPTFVTGGVTAVNTTTGAVTLRTPFGEQIFTLPASANRTRMGTVQVGQTVRLGLSGNGRSFTSVSPLGAMSGGTVSTLGAPGTAIGNTGVTTGVFAGTANTAAPTTTATLAGVQPQRASGVLNTGNVTMPTTVAGLPTGGTLAAGNPNVVGLAGGINTNTAGGVNNGAVVNGGVANGGVATNGLAGAVNTGTVSFPGNVNTGTDLGSTGTIALAGSPFGAVIPSLPSVVGQLNVVPPPAAAPTVPESLPVGAARDLATRDYDSGVRAMALKANEIDAHWFRYRDSCLRDNAVTADLDRTLYGNNRDRQWFVLFNEDVRTPADDNCRQLRVELNRMADDWRDTMTRLEDTARRNDVLPGSMRESRQRYRVEF